MGFKYDFSGWATKNDLLCGDGRTIRQNAFADDDGQIVPLVWNHNHNDPENVLGHALLKNEKDGVRVYGSFNDSPKGRQAKTLVDHGDIKALSIFANKLTQRGGDVLHGAIREVSLVIAGSNPGAFIDNEAFAHGDDTEFDEACIYTGEELIHSAGEIIDKEEKEEKEKMVDDNKKLSENEETIGDVFDTLTEKQKKVVYALIGAALENKTNADTKEEKNDDKSDVTHSDDGGEIIMHNNVFDKNNSSSQARLSAEETTAIFSDVKRYGSLKDACLEHGVENLTYLAHADADYGIQNVGYLFPEARTLTTAPDFIQRDQEWVMTFMNSVHRSPFSRIKSVHANITEDEARAKGYIKGNAKKDEVFPLLKRVTTPTTVYKKQRFDRDDVVDITDFNVVGWIKDEMRVMLNEEIARAALVGDGRGASDDDKISELNIRPIWTDDDLYTIKVSVETKTDDTDNTKAINFIKAIVKNRRKYKGSGNPILFCTEAVLDDMLLITDTTGRDIYESIDKLAKKLRVSAIIPVPVMEGLTRTGSDSKTHTLGGIIVNLNDYNIGADKGGSVNMFDDFDIDFNQYKYLIETRCSGALIKPYSAMAIEFVPNT